MDDEDSEEDYDDLEDEDFATSAEDSDTGEDEDDVTEWKSSTTITASRTTTPRLELHGGNMDYAPLSSEGSEAKKG